MILPNIKPWDDDDDEKGDNCAQADYDVSSVICNLNRFKF